MISKQDILQAVRSIKKHDTGRSKKRLIHPQREWGIALMIFVILLAMGAAYNYYLYQSYKEINKQVVAPEVQVPSYHIEVVADVASTYAERKRQYEAAQLVTVPTAIITSSTSSSTDGTVASDLTAESSGVVTSDEQNADSDTASSSPVR